MKVVVTKNTDRFAWMPRQSVHWHSLRETCPEGTSFEVYGVERRDNDVMFLLIPDPTIPVDVFYSNSLQYDIVDDHIPEDWDSSDELVQEVLKGQGPNRTLLGYQILRSTEDFIWRLSEGDLTDDEKRKVLALVGYQQPR